MSGGPKHICYYSNNCNWSRAFIKEIAQTPWKGLFHYICVDPSPNRQPLPSWLKKVPTLVISGDPEPKTDSEVMNWLYDKKMKESTVGQKSDHQGPVPGAGGEPDAWSNIEQANFGKGGFSYSGLDVDTSAQGSGGYSMPGAFSFLNGAAAGGDQQQMGRSPEPSRTKSKKEEMFDKQMEAYQRDRDIGLPQLQAKRI